MWVQREKASLPGLMKLLLIQCMCLYAANGVTLVEGKKVVQNVCIFKQHTAVKRMKSLLNTEVI